MRRILILTTMAALSACSPFQGQPDQIDLVRAENAARAAAPPPKFEYVRCGEGCRQHVLNQAIYDINRPVYVPSTTTITYPTYKYISPVFSKTGSWTQTTNTITVTR